MNDLSAQVAVYIDFDNILMSHYDDLFGRQAFREDTDSSVQRKTARVKDRLDKARIDLGALIDFASSFGTVAVARAYANWAGPVNSTYANDTMQRSIDLVQLFPMTGAKNGADIRLAIDAIDDVSRYSNITHIVVVAGDSDYVAVAQRCRRLGRRVIGVGAGKSAHRYWRSACDEFKYYALLPGVAKNDNSPGGDLADVSSALGSSVSSNYGALLSRAMILLLRKSDDDFINPGALKNQILRLDASFDEGAAGYRNFTAFLEGMHDIVSIVRVGATTKVRLGTGTDTVRTVPGEIACEANADVDAVPSEEVAAVRSKLGLPRHPALGGELEPLTVAAVRTLCESVSDQTQISASHDIVAALTERGAAEQLARRAAHVITTSGLPVLVRHADDLQLANPEFLDRSDEELERMLREWTVERVRTLMHPEAKTAEVIRTAVFGDNCPANALDHYLGAVNAPGYATMAELLSPLPQPKALWRGASALAKIPHTDDLGTEEGFAAALNASLAETEQLGTADISALHTWFHAADLVDDRGHSQVHLWSDHDIVRCVATVWIDHLKVNNAFESESWLCREGLYRIVLADRYRIDWRQWLRYIIDSTNHSVAYESDIPSKAHERTEDIA